MAKKEISHKQNKKSSRWDYSKTIRVLYGVALSLAIVACVMIGVKTYEDLSSEKSANTLLEAYLKNQEQQQPAAAEPQIAEIRIEEPAEATAAPQEAPVVEQAPAEEPAAETAGGQTAETGTVSDDPADFRHDADNDDVVDETADYVPPEEPVNDETAALIQQIATTVGDDGVIGIIEIPKYDQQYPIIGQWSYKLLKISICRYKGPGVNQSGNLVLIGHNYKSGAHFGNLKNLKKGDEIFLTAAGSNTKVRYEVYDIDDVSPDAFSALDEYEGDMGLTLMTCTSSGNKRKILRCVQKDAPVNASADAGQDA